MSVGPAKGANQMVPKGYVPTAMVRDEGDGGEGDGDGACHVAQVAAHPGTAAAGDVRVSVSEAWRAFGAGGM
jgi:hypothetical protein